MSFRSPAGKIVERIETGLDHHFSNFLFVDQRYGSDPVMRRVLSLARKLDYRSMLIEEIGEAECPLLVEENAALKTRRPDFDHSLVHRLSFFRCSANVNPSPEDFLGYVVFKRDHFANAPQVRGHVYEAVMPSVRGASENNFIHCLRIYQVRTNLGVFQVRGVLYAQQNDMTFVCAHVALRSALSIVLPEGDISYARLNGLAGVDHKKRVVGGGAGLEPADFETILNSLGINFQKVVHEPNGGLILPTEFQRDLYGIIESGCPALMGFELEQNQHGSPPGRHVIPAFGHTFNEDTWLPDAQRAYFGGATGYYPSENWLSSFVVHDDNFGPYYCLPRSFLKKENFRIIFGFKLEPTALSAVEAEAVGFAYFNALQKNFQQRGEDWFDRFWVYARVGALVLRTVFVSKDAYLAQLESARDWNGVGMEADRITEFRNRLPERFWLVEASAPELFSSSRRKFGEVLLSSTAAIPKPLNISLMLGARLPGISAISNAQGLDLKPTDMKGHTPLFSLPVRDGFVAC